jgi:polysaccharide biosynthesis protein PslG
MNRHLSRRLRLLAGGLLMTVVLAAAGCRETPQPVVAPDGGYGFAVGAPQVWMTPEDANRELDAVAETGAQWLRVHIDWHFIEPVRGQFNWSYADRWINGARDRGLKILGLIVNTPDWARAPDAPLYAPAENLGDFGDFVTAVVKRYQKRITDWEIWNEPNLPRFMGFVDVRPRRYVDLLKTAYPAVKAIQPHGNVIAAGLSPALGVDAPPNFVNDMYIAGAKGFFDALAMHPYVYPGGIAADPSNSWSDVARVHDVMTVHGDGDKKIWMTELGAPTSTTTDEGVSPKEQAKQIVDVLAGLKGAGYSGPGFIYSIRDTDTSNQDDVQDNFGALLTSDWQPKYSAAVLAKPPNGGWR